MYDRLVSSVMVTEKLVTAAPATTVTDAARLMAGHNVGAVLIVEDEKLVGIFTERDAVFRVVAKGQDVETTRVSDVMTKSPRTVGPDRSFGYALLMMQEHGFRHVPVVVDGRPVGIVSSRSALDPDMEEFVAEAERRKNIR
jgi:CBS domain-containing protein